MSLNLGEGDEVIVPTFTYIASINTIMQTGATPVYVDSLMETWQMDPTQIAKKITPKTKAIMVVHLYGAACNMDAIMQIAKKHRLLVIEDCAESFGTYYNKQHTGTFGDVATFSFFGNKTITTGEGGMVCCKDPKRYERLITLKNQGICNLPNQTVQTHEYLHHGLAFNYRMTNICAAIGLAQLERAPETLAKKRTLASHYKKFLADLPLITHAEYAPVMK